MVAHEEEPYRGGFLSLDMGMGKTGKQSEILALSFPLSVVCVVLFCRIFGQYGNLGKTLILAGKTIVKQWLGEFHKWTVGFKVFVIESGRESAF